MTEDEQAAAEANTDAMDEASMAPELPNLDPVLLDIYTQETQGHVSTLDKQLAECCGSGTPLYNNHALIRALHTIHGSSRTIGLHALADVARRLEYHGNDQEALGEAWPDATVALLGEAAVQFCQMLAYMADTTRPCPGLADLLRRIDPWAEASSERLKAKHEGRADPYPEFAGVAGVASADAGGGIDTTALFAQAEAEQAMKVEVLADTTVQIGQDGLIEIFIEEGERLVDEYDATMQRWEADCDDAFAEELQRQMYTLEVDARMAELAAISDLSHGFAEVVAGIQTGRVGRTKAVMAALRSALDQLALMLQEVKEQGTLTSANTLVAQLKAICSGETVAGVAESGTAISAEEPAPPDFVEGLETLASGSSKLGEGEDELVVDLSDELVDIFLEEGDEIINACDNLIHEWEASNYDPSYTEELQRQLHTLKGGARMANLAPIGDLSHTLEAVILEVEKGALKVTPAIAEMMKTAIDQLASMLSQVRQQSRLCTAKQTVNSLVRIRRGEDISELVAEVSEPREQGEKTPGSVDEAPAKSEQKTPDFVVPVRRDENAQRFADAAAPAAMTGSSEQIRVRADKLDQLVNNAGEVRAYQSRVQQQLSSFGFNLNELRQTVDRIREQVRQVTIETDAQIDSRVAREPDNAYESFDPLEMDRYSHMQQLARSLMESVNDLADLRDTMDATLKGSETMLHQQQRVSANLQEGLMGTRMVRFDGVTSRLRRLVRQTAQQLGKKVAISFEGVDNEVDRSVQERVLAPLEHMLRNAVSHGIEMPDVRKECGKPEEGRIVLAISRDGSCVVLTLTDDGGGIDADRIRKKAVERGLLQEGEGKPDHEIMQYILHSGLSTADQVTQISGRGVGMDVVNNEIKHLGGSLRIDSELGKGSRFTVRLPLTLAVNQALMVTGLDDMFAIPLTVIDGVARVHGRELTAQYMKKNPTYQYAGADYDIFYLPALLRTGPQSKLIEDEQYPVLLTHAGDRRVAIHVDELLGRREIVVKPVGRQVSTLPGISGATILDNGRVALILEIGGLLQQNAAQLSLVQSAGEAEEKRTTVMVVDDSITIRKVSARFLERNNYDVVTAKDGMDAIAQLENFKPDIMLLDIEMPRMDGYEVATHVRNTKHLEDLPIIMITSRTGDKHRERAMEIGVNSYLGKPFQEAQLLEEIGELMGGADCE